MLSLTSMTQKELAELALRLKKNLDEAEQFTDFIDGLIKNCNKKYLLFMIPVMADAVEYNLDLYNRGYMDRSCINDCPDELAKIVKKVLGK